MKFIDSIKLVLQAGKGGDGAVSFRREKYVPKGGPDGGNGGKGGDVVIQGDDSKLTLLDLRYKKHLKAENGAPGGGRDKYGRGGRDLVVKVPMGTTIYGDDGAELADITKENPAAVLLKGGRGGRGNASYASPTHRAPRSFEKGEPGEEASVCMELKLIADVGVVGYPNAGKSTFISVVSAARPKVADYPFTTLTPVLGVVAAGEEGAFVVADMPGIIDGAYTGTGLGLRFLRHIERTKLLLHFVDCCGDMKKSYLAIRRELELYSEDVANLPEIVVATKIDCGMEKNIGKFERFLNKKGIPLYKISSLSKDGLKELIEIVTERLASLKTEQR